MVSRQSKVVASKDQVSCDLAGEAAILNLADGVYYGLDPVGACIWNMLQEPKSLDELRDGVMNEYEVDAERCEHDILTLLGELEERGLIEIVGGDGA